MTTYCFQNGWRDLISREIVVVLLLTLVEKTKMFRTTFISHRRICVGLISNRRHFERLCYLCYYTSGLWLRAEVKMTASGTILKVCKEWPTRSTCAKMKILAFCYWNGIEDSWRTYLDMKSVTWSECTMTVSCHGDARLQETTFVKTNVICHPFVSCPCGWLSVTSQIAKFMGPICGPPGSCRPQMAPCRPHEPCYQELFYHYGWLNPVTTAVDYVGPRLNIWKDVFS